MGKIKSDHIVVLFVCLFVFVSIRHKSHYAKKKKWVAKIVTFTGTQILNFTWKSARLNEIVQICLF